MLLYMNSFSNFVNRKSKISKTNNNLQFGITLGVVPNEMGEQQQAKHTRGWIKW